MQIWKSSPNYNSNWTKIHPKPRQAELLLTDNQTGINLNLDPNGLLN